MKYLSIVIIFLAISIFQDEKEEIIRFEDKNLFSEFPVRNFVIADFRDTIPNDTLFVYNNHANQPGFYSRKIITGVCIKGECRMVNIELYWNITGRYIGFKLPQGEFLSKTEHVKFKPEEYDRLHILLKDHQSALANYRLEELVPVQDTNKQKVDAVSSATIAAVLDYIVEGAVYTTYTLWHIIYGPAKREIERISTAKITPDLAMRILESQNLRDKVWCLNHLTADLEFTEELQNKLLSYISGNDVYLAERSLNALKPGALDNALQQKLAGIFNSAGFLQKRLIIQKLNEIETLDYKAALELATEMPKLNGALIKQMLELFASHRQFSDDIIAKASELLENENRYISNQAFSFLENASTSDKKVLKKMDKYRKTTR